MGVSRRLSGIVLALACWAVIATGSAAAAPVGVFDLRTDFDARILGPQQAAGAGQGVAAAGDVNGDGREDLLVRSSRVSPHGLDRVHVIFGRDDWSDLDLAAPAPEDGFVVDGTVGPCVGFAVSETCVKERSVAGAGDVNGDGLDDVIVGSPYGPGAGGGSAYVVFGNPSGAPVHVGALGAAGFEIRGGASGDRTGLSVSEAGDVNGDGLTDVVLSGPDRRSAYVVFGKASTGTVQLGALGTAGFQFDPGDEFVDAVGQVAGVGDTNGDGLSDLVVGVPRAGREGNGRVFVIFGKRDTGLVDGEALGAAGYRIENSSNHVSAAAGQSVAAAGDVNQDGRADLLIGAPGADNNVGGSGSVYVLFGKPDTVNLDLASFTNGFWIDGKGVLMAAGTAISGGGDVNGDGRPDIIVGQPLGEIDGRFKGGSAYIVFGKHSPATVRLGGLNPGQVEIGGAQAGDLAGSSVAMADFNGDGRADVLVGATGTDDPRIDGGTAYLVFTRLLPRTLTLSPGTSTNTIGDEHCVTAHVEEAAGGPAAGFPVRFDVTGVNSESATEQTDSAGDAVLCYTGSLAAGTDEIIAYADGNENGFRDSGEPGAVATKNWVMAQSGQDCAVSFHGQITTQGGGRATLSGKAETSAAATFGRHTYLDRTASLRVKSRHVAALLCAEDGSAARLFGEAKVNGGQVTYRIDLGRGGGSARTGSYRIRLDSGYDSGQRALRGGRVTIERY